MYVGTFSAEAYSCLTHDGLLVGLCRAVGQDTDLQTVLLSVWVQSMQEGRKERVNTDVIVVLVDWADGAGHCLVPAKTDRSNMQMKTHTHMH